MKRIPTALAILLLAPGCATQIPEVITVRVPVEVPCKATEPERPRMDTEHLAIDAKVDVQARAMRAEIDRREAYEEQLRVELRACTAPITTPPESFHD
jgi:hypothetical protein